MEGDDSGSVVSCRSTSRKEWALKVLEEEGIDPGCFQSVKDLKGVSVGVVLSLYEIIGSSRGFAKRLKALTGIEEITKNEENKIVQIAKKLRNEEREKIKNKDWTQNKNDFYSRIISFSELGLIQIPQSLSPRSRSRSPIRPSYHSSNQSVDPSLVLTPKVDASPQTELSIPEFFDFTVDLNRPKQSSGLQLMIHNTCFSQFSELKRLTANADKKSKRAKKGYKVKGKKKPNASDWLQLRLKSALETNHRISSRNFELKKRISMLNAKVDKLQNEVRERDMLVVEMSETENDRWAYNTMANGKYTDKVITCIMKLQKDGVADEKIGTVMETVTEMIGVRLSAIPSPTSCRRFAMASLHLARVHVKSEFDSLLENNQNMCLITDETTKGKAKLQLFSIGMGSGQERSTLFFGLESVAEKSSDTAFALLKEMVNRVAITSGENAGFFDKWITGISCTMSDKAHTQQKFNRMVEEYRSEILPKIHENWENISEFERKRISTFSQYYCQLHAVANMTQVVVQALAHHESLRKGRECKEPSVLQLMKEATKYFGERSCGLYGTYKDYEAYSKGKILQYRLPSFLGNRFNIVFLLGARIFSIRDHLTEFIDKFGRGKMELEEIQKFLQDPLVICHLQVLGLIDQFITAPIWRLAEHSNHILDTCEYSTRLLYWLQNCVSSPDLFFSWNSPIASLSPPKISSANLLKSLLAFPLNEISLEVTAISLKSIEKYVSSIFADYLPGGKYHGNMQIIESTSCAPATSRSVESGFGFVSRLFEFSPNMRVSRMEAVTLIKKNHTFEWFEKLTSERQSELIIECRKKIIEIEKKDREKKEILHEDILRVALEKHEQSTKKRAREMEGKTALTDKIMEIGLWKSITEIDSALSTLNTKARKIDALSTQIRFRQKILEQPEPRSKFYTLSVGGKRCEVSELRTRLLELIDKEETEKAILFCEKEDLNKRIEQYMDGI